MKTIRLILEANRATVQHVQAWRQEELDREPFMADTFYGAVSQLTIALAALAELFLTDLIDLVDRISSLAGRKT